MIKKVRLNVDFKTKKYFGASIFFMLKSPNKNAWLITIYLDGFRA